MILVPPATALAANSNSGNVLAGLEFEFIPPPGGQRIIVGVTGSAAGLMCTFLLGGVALASRVTIPPTNRFPVIPDDVILDFQAGAPGQRLFLDFDNTTGGSLTWFAAVHLL
jgi:hypothetical protein